MEPKLQPIECPKCFKIKYGAAAMIEHLVHGEEWRRSSAEEFVQAILKEKS